MDHGPNFETAFIFTYRLRRNWSCDTGRMASIPRPPALSPRCNVLPEMGKEGNIRENQNPCSL